MTHDEVRDAQQHETAALARRHVAALVQPRSLRYWRRGGEPVCSVIDRKGPGGQWEIGYTWSRPYAHHMNGLVYDCILARALGRAAAIARAERIVAKHEQRAAARPAVRR